MRGHALELTGGDVGRELFALTGPLLLGNILQQFYNAADAWIIGRFVGQNAFAAVGVGGTVMNLFVFLLSGCCTGFSVLFAQFFGAKDLRSFRRECFLAVCCGGGATVALSLLALPCLSPLLRAMRTPAEVAPACRAYLVIVCLGLAATYFYNLCAAMLRSVGNTSAALVILLSAMALNIGLDLWFVAGLDFGVKGAAWATVISQGVSALLCYVYLKKNLPQLLFGREDAKLDRSLLKQSASLGLLSALHQSSLYIGKLLIQGTVNAMGTDMITAYTAATRIEGFANSFGDSGAAAMSIFIAQNVGARDKERVMEGFRKGMLLLCAAGLALSGAMYLTAHAGIALMSSQTSDAILRNGTDYLRQISAFYVLCFAGNAFVGWFRGLGMVNIPVAGTCFHISVRVLLSWLLIGKMGLRAVALATGAGWVGVVIFQTVVFRTSERERRLLDLRPAESPAD